MQSYLNSAYTSAINSSPHELMYGVKLSNEVSLLTGMAKGFQDWNISLNVLSLPSPELLEMQWNLNRIMAIMGCQTRRSQGCIGGASQI